MTDYTTLLAEAEKAAHAVYLACAEPVALDLARLLDSLAAALRECIEERDAARKGVRDLLSLNNKERSRANTLRAQVAADHARTQAFDDECGAMVIVCALCGLASSWPCAVRVRLGITEEETP